MAAAFEAAGSYSNVDRVRVAKIPCVALWFVVLVPIACRSGAGPEPRAIDYGSDRCALCGNVIESPRFAAQIQRGGGVEDFDDPGCAVLSLKEEGTEGATLFVRAHDGDAWLRGGEAWFARTPQSTSPRGYGWAAYPSFGAAQEVVTAAGGGEIVQLEQLRGRIGPAPKTN